MGLPHKKDIIKTLNNHNYLQTATMSLQFFFSIITLAFNKLERISRQDRRVMLRRHLIKIIAAIATLLKLNTREMYHLRWNSKVYIIFVPELY